MTQELVDKFISSARGTFLEEDRDSNFPNENTLPEDYKALCEKLVKTWDEVTRMPISYAQRQKELCARVEWIVSSARARLSGC